MVPTMPTQILKHECKGPSGTCYAEFKAGRPVHVIPSPRGVKAPSLVMPTYHYRTAEEGIQAIRAAMATAPTVYSDADLYLYRQQGTPFYLPVGWVDPTMRRAES